METINLSKKQFVIYMAVAFGLAWILEMIASVFSNNGNYGIEAVGIKEMFIGFGSEGNTIEMGCLKLKGWENTVPYHERLKEAYQVLKTYWTGKEYE